MREPSSDPLQYRRQRSIGRQSLLAASCRLHFALGEWNMQQEFMVATQAAGVQPSESTRQLQRLVMDQWQPDEELLADVFGAVAGWDVSLRLPKEARLKKGEGSLFAFSDSAVHLGYIAKQGMFGSAPRAIRIPYSDVRGVGITVVGPVRVLMFEDSDGDELAGLFFQDYPGLEGPTTGIGQMPRIENALQRYFS